VERLRGIAQRDGIDFATKLLYERLIDSPEHGPFIRQINALEPPRRLELTIALVPGACYAEYPHTGADGRILRDMAREWGCRVETIPLLSFGSLQENAQILRRWLAAYTREPLVLVSLSKGSADVRMALAAGDADTVFRRVSTWVNLSGIVWGTPLVNWVLQRRFR